MKLNSEHILKSHRMHVPYLIMQQMEFVLSNGFNCNHALSILLSNQTHLLSMNHLVNL